MGWRGAGGTEAMAKRKAGRPKGSGRPPATRTDYLQVRMTVEFKEWLGRYAASRNLSMADAIVQALLEDAARRGFDPPPRR